MGKYRLLKDLPFAKAGAEVGVELAISVRGKDNFLTWIGNPKDLELLIDEGWIEEVKPREWYEVERLMPNGIWAYESNRYDTEEDAISDYSGDKTKLRVIKVREVLE